MNFTHIAKAIRQHKTFLVLTHVNPDPDALSSQLAVAAYLKKKGKKVLVLAEDVVPARYAFLPGASTVEKFNPKKKYVYDVAVVLDCGDLDRVGVIQKILDPKKQLVNIDHHVTNDHFGTINFVVPQASSTAEVVFEFLHWSKFSFDKPMAALLYLGIMTDTGSFRYENTTARTHEVVSQLLKFDLPVSQYYRRLYETIPLIDLTHFAKLITRFDSYFGGQVIALELDGGWVKKFSEEFDLRDKIFGYLRAIKGAEVFVILTELGKNKTRINLRSQTRFNVAHLAGTFGGGGHSRASGCVINVNMKSAKLRILSEIKKSLKKKI